MEGRQVLAVLLFIAVIAFMFRQRSKYIREKEELHTILRAQQAKLRAGEKGRADVSDIPKMEYPHPSQVDRNGTLPTWADLPDQKMPTWDEWGNIVKNGWEHERLRLYTDAPIKTKYTLYAPDMEDGGAMCRHCRASYNFGHFPGCLYDADWHTDKRRDDIARYVEKLEAFLAARGAPSFGVPEHKKMFDEDKRMVHHHLGIS